VACDDDPELGETRRRGRPAHYAPTWSCDVFGEVPVSTRPGISRGAAKLAILSAVAIAAASCASGGHSHGTYARLTARIRPVAPATSVLGGGPDALAAGLASKLLTAAPVVVIGSTGSRGGLSQAAAWAEAAHAPLLLTSPGSARGQAALREEVRDLHPDAVLAAGVSRTALARQLGRVRVVSRPAGLPSTRAPVPAGHEVVLLRRGHSGAVAAAVAATARVAGAQVIEVRGDDPRADPAAIAALAAARPGRVIAVGSRFGPARRLAARVGVAETGTQLPGGGQVLFPGHRLVALYGHPGTAALGALGQQGLAASIARVRRAALPYRRLSRVPVVPAFELIATVAEGSPGPDHTYSYQTPLSQLRPWVRRATRARMYVVLDLQPGRASLLAQAKKYAPLLERPNVGLALDPEWKLQPGQKPLQQIGGVSITEVNSVVRWLARLTAQHHLPQKLLVLHQFRLSMIQEEQRLDTHEDNIAIVIHMDGQGSPGAKQQTWEGVLGAAPRGVFFGWKDFYVKDHPMLTPQQTMDHRPQPVMISYQ
jgi:hypothetical protein